MSTSTRRVDQAPTLDELRRHAQLFGTERVFETAEQFLGPRELLRLRTELDAIEANRRGRRSGVKVGKRRRRASSETVAAVRRLQADGLVAGAISEKLGISDAYAKRCLRESGTCQNGAFKPHGYAAKMATKSKARVTVE